MAVFNLIIAGFTSVAAYWVVWITYSLNFHPLAKYPGPRLAAITEIWYARSWTSGYFVQDVHGAHLKYGPVVRIGPNELSFGTVQAAKDILGPPSKGKKLFPKSDLFYDLAGGPISLAWEIDPERHAEKRKLFVPGFRGQSIALQERIVHEHVDLMIEQLPKWGKLSGGSVDVTKMHSWLAFDITGQLVFGESFGAIANGRSHEWVSILLDVLYSTSFVGMRKRMPALSILFAVMPYISKQAANTMQTMKTHAGLTLQWVRKRTAKIDNDTPDIMQYVLEKGNLSEPQLMAEASSLIVAGAETTATVLSATVWYLIKNPETLIKLQSEVREAFASYDEITGDATVRLPYLNAVIEESMRIFSPVPEGLPRMSAGATVDGDYIPAGVYVSVMSWHVHLDPENAPDPYKFDPERWIDAGLETTRGALDEDDSTSGGIAQDGKLKPTKQKPFTFPFAMGPRGCLGINLAYLELRLTIAKLVYRYDWTLSDEWLQPGRDWPSECTLRQLWHAPELGIKFTPV